MSQVDEVRAAADIVKIVGDYLKLRKAGQNFMGLCPFHHEKTPSFAVHPVKQIFHCFGCGVGGDVFKFVMLIENVTFPEALERIAEKIGVRLHSLPRDKDFDVRAEERAALYKLHEVAGKFYASQLGGTAEGRAARGYLEDRGLTDEIVGRFRLGYAPAEGSALAKHLSAAGFKPEHLEKSGLVLRDAATDRRYDRFRRRIIFPIQNESGRVVAFGGRALGDEMPKYLNSSETPIYTKSRVLYNLDRAGAAIRKLDFAILVEGYMDCIAVASSGVENVVASCGTSLAEGQIRLMARYTRRVVVNYDPDSAGQAATERSLVLLLEEGFEAKVLALPGGLDPDSFIRKQGAGAYKERLASAPTYLDYLTDRAAAQHDLSRPEGKVAAANAVMPYLVRVPNAMLRAELASRLAVRLRLDDRLLRGELRRAADQGRKEMSGVPSQVEASPAEKTLLGVFLENRELADEFLPAVVEEGLTAGQPSEGIFARLRDARARGESIEISALEAHLNEAEKRLIYRSRMETAEPGGRGEVQACIRALRMKKAQREREALTAEIERAEKSGDGARLAELQRAKSKVDRELRELVRR